MNLEKEKEQSLGLLHTIIYLLFTLGPLTGNVILILFGVLSVEFGVPPTSVALAIPSFMFPFAIIQLFSGAISDVKGRIPVILSGLIIFGIGMGLALMSLSLEMYMIANVLGGIGFGFVNPVLIALISDISKGPDIPKKMGFLGAVANLGVGLGPILAGQLIHLGWRYLYVIFISITIIGLIILFFLKRSRGTVKKEGGIKTLFSHLSIEIKRLAIILLILSAFFTTLSYLAVITWTSQALSEAIRLGTIPGSLAGIIIGLAGIFGAIAGVIIGIIIKNKGVIIALIVGVVTFYISLAILLSLGNIARMEVLVFVALGLIFVGISGGTLLPAIMFYSQTLSHERRGALAGLSTAGQFIGIAIIPIIYLPFFNQGGITLVYFIILFVSFIFVIIITLLYIVAKKSSN